MEKSDRQWICSNCEYILKEIPSPEVVVDEFTKDCFILFVRSLVNRKREFSYFKHRRIIVSMGFWGRRPKYYLEDWGDTLKITFAEYALYEITKEDTDKIMGKL